MKIVFVTLRLPYPPNRGDRIRTYYHLRHLARRHEVHLVSLIDADDAPESVIALQEMCASVSTIPLEPIAAAARCAAALANGTPLAAAYAATPRLRHAVAAAVDGAQADLLWLSNGALLDALGAVLVPRRIVDLVDADSDKWRQFASRSWGPLAAVYRREARLTRDQEGRALRAADRCLVISSEEADLLRTLTPAAPPAAVVPAAIDLAMWPRAELSPAPVMLFTGRLDYIPNQDAVSFFADEVLPLLRRRLPAARFAVVGARPPARLRRQAARLGFELNPDVADVRPHFAAARACVAPMRCGRGVQNKVLEAMACGLPVVASPLALTGLADWHEPVALRAGSAEELAEGCFQLLTDDATATRLADAAHRFVSDRHSCAAALSAIDRVLDDFEAGDEPATAAAR